MATTKDTNLLDSWPQTEKDQAVVRLFFFLNICLLRTISALPSKDTDWLIDWLKAPSTITDQKYCTQPGTLLLLVFFLLLFVLWQGRERFIYTWLQDLAWHRESFMHYQKIKQTNKNKQKNKQKNNKIRRNTPSILSEKSVVKLW